MRIFERLDEMLEMFDHQFGHGRTTTEIKTTNSHTLHEVGDEYNLTLDAPGFRKDEFDIQAVGHTLHIKAQLNPENHKASSEPTQKIWGRSAERHFHSSFTLPGDADMANIQAMYDSGVLVLLIGKTKDSEKQGKKIEVK